jgi:hypothetical protein
MVEEIIFVWQAWMHELQVENHFLVPLQSYLVHNFVWMLCTYLEMSLSFLIVTFINLVRVFNMFHLPKWHEFPLFYSIDNNFLIACFLQELFFHQFQLCSATFYERSSSSLWSLKLKRYGLFINFPCNMYILLNLLVSMFFFVFLSFVTYNSFEQGIQLDYNCRLSPVTCMPTNCPHFVLVMFFWCLCKSIESQCVIYSSLQEGIHSKQPQSILCNMPTNCV